MEGGTDIADTLPLPLSGLDSDSGGEFINRHLKDWCEKHSVNFTRGRQCRKNDNAYVEQKNGAAVRKTVGCGRYSGERGIAALQAVYTPCDRLLNYFYPCMKLLAKERAGPKVKKTCGAPQTPFARALSGPDISASVAGRLSAAKADIGLMDEMESMRKALDSLPSQADTVPEFIYKKAPKPFHIKPSGYGSLRLDFLT